MQMKPCRACGKDLAVVAKSRPEPTCQECRRAAWPKCSGCGKRSTVNLCPTCVGERSRTAKAEAIGERRSAKLHGHDFECAWCGNAITRPRRRPERTNKACSHACRVALTMLARGNAMASPWPRQPNTCNDCDVEIAWHKHRCKPCADAANRAAVTLARTTRRLREKTAFVERVDPYEIYERDNGVCWICGEPVDLDLPASDPMCFNLDHVWPIARGGTHERDNLGTTHRICNQRKSARAA